MNRGLGNPLGLGLVIVGAFAVAIAAFLPLDEPTGVFRMVENNTLIQHGGWMLVVLAVGIAASGFRVAQRNGIGWAVPVVLCVIAGILIAIWAADKDLRTLYPVGPDGTPMTSQPGMVASLGIAIYVAGAGVGVALIGSLMLRQTEKSVDRDPLVAAWEAARTTKKCPDCAETVLADAKVCKNCGYRFAAKPVSASVDTGPAAVEPTLVGERQPTQLASAIPHPPQQPRPPRELNRPLPKRRRTLVIGAAAVVVVATATAVAYLVMARTSESSQPGAAPSSQQAAAPSSPQVAAPPAGAQPPFRLADYVTDKAGVLSESGRARVTSAIDKLYADRQIRLWVVYVDNFAGLSAENWSKSTYSNSDLGGYDSMLAVSVNGRAYAMLVPVTVQGVSQSQIDNLRHNQIEPALRAGNWSGAAVAAADGLDSAAG
jgi:hypothetical protein